MTNCSKRLVSSHWAYTSVIRCWHWWGPIFSQTNFLWRTRKLRLCPLASLCLLTRKIGKVLRISFGWVGARDFSPNSQISTMTVLPAYIKPKEKKWQSYLPGKCTHSTYDPFSCHLMTHFLSVRWMNYWTLINEASFKDGLNGSKVYFRTYRFLNAFP